MKLIIADKKPRQSVLSAKSALHELKFIEGMKSENRTQMTQMKLINTDYKPKMAEPLF